MKKKISFRFLGTIILSVILIIILSFLSASYFIFSKDTKVSEHPPHFTMNFHVFIEGKDEAIHVNQEGKEKLRAKDSWIQILDSNGNEIYEFDKPKTAPEHYSPASIVNYHIHNGLLNGYTIFVRSREGDPDLSYIIGFPESTISKYTFTYDMDTYTLILKLIFILVLVSLIVFIIVGYFFGKNLTDPIVKIIEGIEKLSRKDYYDTYKEEGIYSNVFNSLNKLSKNLEVNEKEVKKTEKMREEWISNISHDLKTPLSSIKGYAEILSDDDYDVSKDEIRNYSHIIVEKAIYMEDMIEELRLNERLKNNILDLKKVKINLTKFLRKQIIDILNHPEFNNRIVHFETNKENIEFEFDYHLMSRSISNLIYNALVHNNEGTEIYVNLWESDNIYISIKDDGKGISKRDLENLFNRYYRGTNTDNHKGTGLGMSIAKEVIELHGGSIAAKSELGKGTEILIILDK